MPEQNEQTKLLMQILEELKALRELMERLDGDGTPVLAV